jgi:predicted RNA binding protein YcfA (HicA-like mRNA interferase family)
MAAHEKTLDAVLRGTSDANIGFRDLCNLLTRLGFEERIRGSHHIYTRQDIEEILNLQSKHGKAKAYQVKQVRRVIVKYRLAGDNQ